MIIMRIKGGLGNQMFQYALGCKLSLEHNSDLKLDLSWFEGQKKRVFELDQFNINVKIADNDYIRELIPFSSHRVVRGFSRHIQKWLPAAERLVYMESKPGFFDPQVVEIKGNKYLDGYWQSEKYFKNVENQIRARFTLNQPLSNDDMELAKEMAGNRNSVGVHIRRRDYVTDHWIMRSHYICTPDYYLETMQFINDQLNGNAFFYVFSDDPEWCQTGLKNASQYRIVSTRTRSNVNELILMSNCRHAIISNSSFGWWAAWLIDNPEKIVISPKKWFYNHAAPDIPAEHWITYQHETSNDGKYIDIPYAKSRYLEKYNRELNLESPQAFSEKLQWLKLYDHDPFYSTLADMFAVREYISEKIGEDYVKQLFGVYQSSSEIEWKKLPDRFVLKATHGCG